MSNMFKVDFDEIKRTRMAILMGLDPDDRDRWDSIWPLETIDKLIEGEDKNGFEWLMGRIKELANE